VIRDDNGSERKNPGLPEFLLLGVGRTKEGCRVVLVLGSAVKKWVRQVSN